MNEQIDKKEQAIARFIKGLESLEGQVKKQMKEKADKMEADIE